jgi:hypothetical protein
MDAEIILADIFISYSQGSPEATQELAVDLTSKGYGLVRLATPSNGRVLKWF